MQQLKVEQKNDTITTENKREGHGLNIALTRDVYRIVNSDTFYVQSESRDIYYFVRYEPSFHWCSCMDNSTRHVKCKHIFAVEFAIVKGTLKDTEKLPAEAKRHQHHETLTVESPTKSYRDDNYDF